MNNFGVLFVMSLLVVVAGCGEKSSTEQHTPSSQEVVKPSKQTREELRHAASSAAAKVVEDAASDVKVVDLKALAFYKKTVTVTIKGGKGVKSKKEKKEMLVRRKVNDFYAEHLGLPKTEGGVEIPDSLPVSFDKNLAAFWHSKVMRENVSDSTLGKTPEILERYLSSPRDHTTLPLFVKHVDLVVGKAKKSLDWGALCKRYKLGDTKNPKCVVLQAVVSNLHGKDFIAYGVTELLPNNPELNVLYLDMLLRNAGVSYIMHTPAMHDNMLSLGFYQFTSFSVRKDEEETEGASVVNGFVKDGGITIPDSVAYLKGDDHHVAAVYFAVHNLAKMVAKLSPKGVTMLASKHQNFQDEVVMFIASAHHLPGPAWRSTAKWIEGGMKGPIHAGYQKAIKLYALKTHGNLIALYKK